MNPTLRLVTSLPLPVSLRTTRLSSRRPTGTSPLQLSARVLRGEETSEEPSRLVLELVGDEPQWDPFLLMRFEMTAKEYMAFKKTEALLVDFNAFPQHLIGLLEKCVQHGDVFTAAIEDDTNAIKLVVLESTTFRELTHLNIPLIFADSVTIVKHLADRLKQESQRVTIAHENVQELKRQLENKDEMLLRAREEVSAARRAMDSERMELLHSDDKRRQEAFREARSLVTEEERARRDKAEARVLELEVKLRIVDEELAKAKTERIKAEAELTRASGATDSNTQLRAEASELRQRVRDFESRAFEESSRCARLEERVAGLERELGAKETLVAKSNELLMGERTTVERLEKALHEESARLESLLRNTHDSSFQIESLRTENDTLKSKIATKNLVIRQQETVVRDRTAEVDRLYVRINEMDRELAGTKSDVNDLHAKLMECKTRLQESAEALESNTKVISYLSRELNQPTRHSGGGSGEELWGSESTRFHEFRPSRTEME